ncbi:MAG: hypothetical protein R2822_02115 [Spirosomataceae bacterium]
MQNIIGLQNNFDFLEVGKDVIAKWELLENNNIIQSKVLSKINIEPHQCKEIEVNIKSFQKIEYLYVLRVVSYFSENHFGQRTNLFIQKILN